MYYPIPTAPSCNPAPPQARAEAARSRTDADCTFKPELVTKKSGQVSREGSVFDTLYKKVGFLGGCTLSVAWRSRFSQGRQGGAVVFSSLHDGVVIAPWCSRTPRAPMRISAWSQRLRTHARSHAPRWHALSHTHPLPLSAHLSVCHVRCSAAGPRPGHGPALHYGGATEERRAEGLHILPRHQPRQVRAC
jgi:hypothetical protein